MVASVMRPEADGAGSQSGELHPKRLPARHHRAPWLLVLPAAMAYGAFLIYPDLRSVVEAFTNWSGILPGQKFVGLTNFWKALHDSIVIEGFRNVAVIAVVVTVVQNGLGLLAALALHRKLKSRLVLRAFFFLPVLINPLVIAYVWQFIFTYGGPLDSVLSTLHLQALEVNYLGTSHYALASCLVPMCWQYVGYSMVIFLAGLEGIPSELGEAADLDGAGRWQHFRNVTWPLLAPALTINALLTVVGGLNAFTVIFALTNGGPGNATQTVTTILFSDSFLYGQYGYGTAIAVMLSIVVVGVAFALLKGLRVGSWCYDKKTEEGYVEDAVYKAHRGA